MTGRKTGLAAIVVGVFVTAIADRVANGQANAAPATKGDRPFFAIWNDDSSIRFAVWEDGRVVFAKSSAKQGDQLQRGKITANRVARLKKDLIDSGAFALKGTCYLVPDGGCICLMADLGEKKQMLYWDEVETPNYGININPKPRHLEFIRCWKAINALAVAACPDQFEAVKEAPKPQPGWYLKPPIQSE